MRADDAAGGEGDVPAPTPDIEHAHARFDARVPECPDGGGAVQLALEVQGKILRVLEETDGNKARAATQLGISRETLYQKLKQYQSD